MKKYEFMQVDVFARVPLEGNPCALLFDADELFACNQIRGDAWDAVGEDLIRYVCLRGDAMRRPYKPGLGARRVVMSTSAACSA